MQHPFLYTKAIIIIVLITATVAYAARQTRHHLMMIRVRSTTTKLCDCQEVGNQDRPLLCVCKTAVASSPQYRNQ